MKRVLIVNQASAATDMALLIARIGIGVLMLTHGLPKLTMLLSGGPVQFPGLFGLSSELSLVLAIFAEVVCSLFVIAGFGTRLAVLPLMTTMLVAFFYVHAADPFSKKELPLHYLLMYAVLFFAGSGRYSVDALLHRKLSGNVYATT